MNKILYEAYSFFLNINGELIKIQNPEILPSLKSEYTPEGIHYTYHFLPSGIKVLKFGDLFPIPEGIEWEIENPCKCNPMCRHPFSEGACRQRHQGKKLAILKLKAQPEKGAGDDYPVCPFSEIVKIISEPVEVKGESQDSRITVAANVIRFLSEYIHGLNSGRSTDAVDLALLNASDQLRILTRKAIDK